MRTPSSAIAWQGPSLFNGDTIQVVVTGMRGTSKNDKTGAMVQVSIVRKDSKPAHDYGTKRERAICGDCPFRGRKELVRGKLVWTEKRICYVRWASFLLGQHMHKYRVFPTVIVGEWLAGKKVRLGSFGDPAAVPVEVWHKLLAKVAGWTAYTHAWRTCDQRLREIAMASVEDRHGYLDALSKGWRTFRARPPANVLSLQHLAPSEFMCPAETRGMLCENCMLCCGTSRLAHNPVITAHGTGASAMLRVVQPTLFRNVG